MGLTGEPAAAGTFSSAVCHIVDVYGVCHSVDVGVWARLCEEVWVCRCLWVKCFSVDVCTDSTCTFLIVMTVLVLF